MEDATIMLDSTSGVPLYHQLKERFRHKIVSGEWGRDARIPSEPELCAAYGVSRITIRGALAELVTEGWLYRQRGKGTFVRSAKPEIALSPLFILHHVTTDFEGSPDHIVLDQGMVTPPAAVRAALDLDPRGLVFEIVRVRTIGGEPRVFESGYVPRQLMKRLPRLADLRRAYFYDILRYCTGIAPIQTRVILEAVRLRRKEAKILRAPAGSPALRLERRTTSASGTPVLVTHNLLAGDHCRYVFNLNVNVPAGDSTTGVAGDFVAVTAGAARQGRPHA